MLRERGFSLLETIAAILLLSIAFGALVQVSGASTHLTTKATKQSRAAMWADSKLEALGHGEPFIAGHSEGRFDTTFRWDMTITPAAEDTSDLHLYRVDLDVLWKEGMTTARLHFITLRLQDEIKPRGKGGEI
ncbi:hypothetical protein GCM10009552_34320 [Rothia nasimurium]